MGRLTARRRVLRVTETGPRWADDRLAGEEPLEIRVDGVTLTVTMRTPGDDLDLALGVCLSEGVVHTADDVVDVRACAENTVDVRLRRPVELTPRLTVTSSACGVCGSASIDASIDAAAGGTVHDDPIRLEPPVLAGLPDRLQLAQRVFRSTGGLHAAGLFTAAGQMLDAREDIGRHNAVDKLLGGALRQGGLPLTGHLLLVSGRASFELVQKALTAGIPALAAVSAPSTLAVDLAARAGLTLIGFLRGPTMNVYTRVDRLLPLVGNVVPDDARLPAEAAEQLL